MQANGYPYLDGVDGEAMKRGLEAVWLDNFVRVAEVALERSGASVTELAFVCPLHMKRPMHEALLAPLGLDDSGAVYLDDAGHMSGVDSLLGLDRVAREGRLRNRDLVLLLSAGAGYTWAATVVRSGSAE